MTSRQLALFLAVATLSASAACAQSADPAPSVDSSYSQSQPAPIVRSYAPAAHYGAPQRMLPTDQRATLAVGGAVTTTNGTATVQPVAGVLLRVGQNSSVREVAANEFRVERGLLNVNVHHPAQGSELLVDLPGGQTSLLKDGLYTFNAATNTVRTLKGEAAAFPSANPGAKGIKVKEDHALTFGAGSLHPREFYPMEARADLVPYTGGGYAPGYGYGYSNYAYGPYGDGFYGYPYYDPYFAYGWGYPYYGWGYPGFGIGFGYFGGGFYRGGFRR